jgi:hypothetical protein
MFVVTHPSGKPSWKVPDPALYLAAGWKARKASARKLPQPSTKAKADA